MSLAPLLYRIRKRVSMARNLADAARETVAVAEAETGLRTMAAFLPGQLDRVKGVQFQTTHQQEMDRITATPVHHAATMAYRLRDCLLIGGTLYSSGGGYQILSDRPPLAALVNQEIDQAAFVGTPVSDVYFGHHLIDDSATALLARDFAPIYRPFSYRHASWNHPVAYRQMMGIDWKTTGNARITDAWVFCDVGMTQNRRKRLIALRERLQARPSARSGHGVFLIRGETGSQPRLLRNEAAISEKLATRGFEIVDPAKETADNIVRKLSGARIAIGVEGSSLGHALLTLADHGALLTIQPPYRFNNVWKDFTDVLGMRYGFAVAKGDRDGFDINLDDILRTIDLVAEPKPMCRLSKPPVYKDVQPIATDLQPRNTAGPI